MDLSRTLPEGSPSRPLKHVISVLPTQSLLEAASLLIGNRIHRLPMVDRKTPEPPSMRPPRMAPVLAPPSGPADAQPMSVTPSSLGSGTTERRLTGLAGCTPLMRPCRWTALGWCVCVCVCECVCVYVCVQ
jgi:CBS domain-containing protein